MEARREFGDDNANVVKVYSPLIIGTSFGFR
jgi:hypothetical protein